MFRNALGGVVGILVAVATVFLMQKLGHMAFPPPTDLDVNNTEMMNEYLAGMPLGALIIVLAGYLIATFDGVFVACLIGRAKPFIYALIVGVPMLAATSSNLMMIRHPTWFSVAAVLGIVASAWLAALLAAATVSKESVAE